MTENILTEISESASRCPYHHDQHKGSETSSTRAVLAAITRQNIKDHPEWVAGYCKFIAIALGDDISFSGHRNGMRFLLDRLRSKDEEVLQRLEEHITLNLPYQERTYQADRLGWYSPCDSVEYQSQVHMFRYILLSYFIEQAHKKMEDERKPLSKNIFQESYNFLLEKIRGRDAYDFDYRLLDLSTIPADAVSGGLSKGLDLKIVGGLNAAFFHSESYAKSSKNSIACIQLLSGLSAMPNESFLWFVRLMASPPNKFAWYTDKHYNGRYFLPPSPQNLFRRGASLEVGTEILQETARSRKDSKAAIGCPALYARTSSGKSVVAAVAEAHLGLS